MNAKPHSTDDKSATTETPHPASAQNIWLAGLGALSSAQAEGSKAFESLVKQGMAMQARTQEMAKERMAAAAEQFGAMTAQAATPAWDRLGGIFEDRVARALVGLGMPTAQQLASLTERVEALEQALLANAARKPASPTTKTPQPEARKRASSAKPKT